VGQEEKCVSSREAVDGTKKREESKREKLINKETRGGGGETNQCRNVRERMEKEKNSPESEGEIPGKALYLGRWEGGGGGDRVTKIYRFCNYLK